MRCCVKALQGPAATQRRRARKLAITVWFTNLTQFSAFGLAFYYGSVTVDQGQCS